MSPARLFSPLILACGFLLTPSAFAGYVAESLPFIPQNSYGSNTLPSESYYASAIYFGSVILDTAIDVEPPILILSGRRSSIVGDRVTYAGTFSFKRYYGASGGFNEVFLGGGTYTMTLTGAETGGRTISGSLLQTTPKTALPPNPFPDPGAPYANHEVELSGTVDPSWRTSLTLRQRAVAVVPEPATCVALGFGALAILRRRRR